MLDVKLKLQPGHTSERTWMAPSPLRQLCWNLTYACNYSCGICFTDSGRRADGELTTAEGVALVRAARAAGVKDIIVSGGEPFARPDLIELLDEMKAQGLTARVATNGSLLSGDTVERLRRETSVTSFQVSLDTLDPGLYARLHGTGAGRLDTALATLARILAAGFHTTVSTRLTPETVAGIPALIDRAHEEGWATVTVHLPVHTRRAHGAAAPEADALELLEPALEHFCSGPSHWLVETYIPWAAYHPVMERLARKVRVVHRGCRAGRDRLTVTPTGLVTPCVCLDLPGAAIGDVRRDDIAHLFAEAPLCQLLRDPAAAGVCSGCEYLPACGGGCRAAAIAATGALAGQDPTCPVWRRRAAEAG